jgi:hypothetical protein
MRRGVGIAQDSGNRTIETHLAGTMAGLEAQHGDPLAALDYFLVSIRHLHDSGNSTTIRATLADLAALFNRLGHRGRFTVIYEFSVGNCSAFVTERSSMAL